MAKQSTIDTKWRDYDVIVVGSGSIAANAVAEAGAMVLASETFKSSLEDKPAAEKT